jgi:hypothetical protein
MRKDYNGELAFGYKTATGSLYFLDKKRIIRGVLELVADIHHLALNDRIIMPYRIHKNDTCRLKFLVACMQAA